MIFLTEKLTLSHIREKARELLKGICGVYRICDGLDTRLCQGQSYGRTLGMGGIGSGASFNNNYLALKKLNLKMRIIHDHFEPNTQYEFFERTLAMPIMGASTSGVYSFGGEEVITERDFCRSVVLGCKKAGAIGWRGDTYTYSLENAYGLEAIAEVNGFGIKIVKPREQDAIIEFFKKAEEIGCPAVGIDVDGCGSSMMITHNTPVFNKSPEDIKELVKATSLPVIIKGILCVEDAVSAVEAGASAIVVSNHGGRALDHTPGTAEVLPEIATEIKGKARVIVDGCIRTGYDVLKMLALGAEAVLIGRDIIRAAVGGGIEGVRIQMEYLRKTLARAMKMTNCKSLDEISSEILS